MGVQLNIKDERTVALARELADATGRTVTETIRSALEAARQRREEDVAERIRKIDELVAELQRSLPPEYKGITSKEAMDSIYDKDGLPI